MTEMPYIFIVTKPVRFNRVSINQSILTESLMAPIASYPSRRVFLGLDWHALKISVPNKISGKPALAIRTGRELGAGAS
jgi:hypothetical protein